MLVIHSQQIEWHGRIKDLQRYSKGSYEEMSEDVLEDNDDLSSDEEYPSQDSD